jgi:hypothetical protein
MTLDGKQIVFNETILAANDQKVEFEVHIEEESLFFGIVFRSEQASEQDSQASLKAELDEPKDRLILSALNWNNSLGTASKEPILIAQLGKKEEITYSIYCLMAHQKIGVMNVASLQILLEPLL